METEVILDDRLHQQLTTYRAMSTADLRAAIADVLRLTVERIWELSLMVRVMAERGEDLSDSGVDLIGYARKVGQERLHPELVLRYLEHKSHLNVLEELPLEIQERLACGERLPVWFRREDGTTDQRMVTPLQLDARELRQIVQKGRILGQAEQLAALDRKQQQAAPRPVQASGNVRPDRKHGGIVVGRKFVPGCEALRALAQVNTLDDDAADDEEHRSLSVTLPASLHGRLKKQAAEASVREGREVSMGELVRRALLAVGLFGQVA